MGRLVTFLARIVQDGWASEAKGIGIDERTALLVEPDGSVTRVGEGAAYFLRTPGSPEVCLSRTPLTFRGLSVYRIDGAAAFNLSTWSASGGTAYLLSAENGVLTSTQANGAIY
jgi:cyanophycinase-like exopeptidase